MLFCGDASPIHIFLSGATSLRRKNSTGNTRSSTCTQENNGRYQQTHRIDDTVLHNNGPYRGNAHSSGNGGKLFRKLAFLKATQILFQMCVKVMDLFSITTLIRATHLLLQGDLQQQTEHREQLPTLSWYIGICKEQLQRPLQSRHPSYRISLTS